TIVTAVAASERGMIVNTIQCGTAADTRQAWQRIAQNGRGQYFAIPQNGGVETIATPFDEKISQLGAKLGGTYLAYGGGAGEAGVVYRDEAKKRADLSEATVAASAPSEARVQRSFNKAINT